VIAFAAATRVPAQTAQTATLTVRGEVTDSTGAAVVGAQVSVGATGTVVTGEDGHFTLPSVPIGKTHIAVRRLGFRPVAIDLNLITEPGFLPIVLAAIPEALSAVTVQARREVFDTRLSGFNVRKTRGMGYFLTRDQIEHTTSSHLVDALRSFPGVRVLNLRNALGRSVSLGGANCPPLVFLDGFPATAGPLDLDGIELGSLEGVEVYAGSTGVPPELIGPRGLDRCGVIALWSAPSRPRRSASEQQEVDVDELVAKGAVFTANQVDRQATYEEGSGVPVYPEALAKAQVRGRVVVAVVVSARGGVEPGTISVVTTTDTSFSKAAVDAAVRAQFAPAMLHGKAVRQLVRLPFEFNPSETIDSTRAAIRRP
jgi:TonB family protein